MHEKDVPSLLISSFFTFLLVDIMFSCFSPTLMIYKKGQRENVWSREGM